MFAECKRLAKVAQDKNSTIKSFMEQNDKIHDLVEMQQELQSKEAEIGYLEA